MFFFSADRPAARDKYGLLIDAAKFADDRGFCCIWTPERHFHQFGGLFPNPAVTSAALATITRRLQIRAGSLISPLHDVIRIVEEWSMVDNLSNGRVAISFGSGWNINDFAFFPDRYASRQAVMYQQIETIKKLWAGEKINFTNSNGKETAALLYPAPLQKELPIWITSSGNSETFVSAGKLGANLLTHLIGQDLPTLAEKIALYRTAREQHGFDPGAGKVSLMLHTFLGPDRASVKAKVRAPFREYLRSAISLEEMAARGGGVISGGHRIQQHEIPPAILEELLDLTFERYFQTAALMGTIEDCRQFVFGLEDIGVNEIACLIDFLDERAAMMESLKYLAELIEGLSAASISHAKDLALAAFSEDLEG